MVDNNLDSESDKAFFVVAWLQWAGTMVDNNLDSGFDIGAESDIAYSTPFGSDIETILETFFFVRVAC
jgi:hypothetical protein